MIANAPTLAAETRAIMKKGSKTFSFAALLFDRECREGAQLLYTWCRACDDAVDNEPNPERALAKLTELREKTKRAFEGIPSNDLTFEAFSLLNRKHGIEENHAQALLDGMQMDVEGARIRDDETLDLYCYRVAGVVGLMMSKIMGVNDARAVQHAIDTGKAMQLTNIARDILEDRERNRNYIPDSWNSQSDREAARILVERAEELYRSGQAGLRYLPLRAALAVGCAQVIYRAIGREVVKRKERAWDTRTVISLPKKILLAVSTLVVILAARGIMKSRLRLRIVS